jgi:glycosyltransferase involved in cell wall biosynthesis
MDSGISIAMATFNGERYLWEQLQSLSRQTLQPLELVVTDDGSTDATLKILENFSATAPFTVRIYRNLELLGFADNFLRAASLCNGSFIAFCDQDDVWNSTKLEKSIAYLSNPMVNLVVHPAEEVDSELRFLHVLHPNIRKTFTIDHSPEWRRRDPHFGLTYGCTMLMRSSIAREALKRWPMEHLQYVQTNGVRSILGHDTVCFFVARGMGSIVYLGEPLLLHRRHGSNTWSSMMLSTREKLKNIATFNKDVFLDYDRERRLRAEMYLRIAAHKRDKIAEVFETVAERLIFMAKVSEARAQLYNMDSPVRRVGTFGSMLAAGYYNQTIGGLPVRSLLKDLAVVLFGLHMVG